MLDEMQRQCDVDCFMAMRKSLIFRGYILLQYPCNDLLSPMKSFKLESFEGHMQYKYVFMYNATKLEQSVRIFKCI